MTAPPAARAAAPWPRWFWPLFVVGLAAAVLPLLLAPVLPMSDVNGSAGVVGALLQRSNPASHIEQYYLFHVHASPNAFYTAFTYVLGHVMPVRVATNVYLAVFCVAGMPLAFLFALRATGGHPALAFAALAASYHRCLWYGFLGSVAAVSFLFLLIGFMSRAFVRREISWWDGGVALALVLLATAHAFLYLVGVGLLVVWAALAWRQPSPLYRRLVVAAPSIAYLGPWLVTTLKNGTRGASKGLVSTLWAKREPVRSYFKNMHQWFLNAYTSHVDEVVAAVFALTLLAFLIVGIRAAARPNSSSTTAAAAGGPGPGDARPRDRLWGSRLAVTTALLWAGYFLLPMSIPRPVPWWAVNVRLLVPAALTLLLIVPKRRWGLPAAALLPLWLAAVGYAGYIAVDFRTWWVGVELAGLWPSLNAIPPGERVHAIYPRFEGERHYSHFPMAHIVDWYVVERGGTATPAMTSVPHELWATWIPIPAAAWGLNYKFSWPLHSPYWDYYLVKQPAPGNGYPFQPFATAPPGAVTKVFERGLWSVWKPTGL